MNTQIIEKLKKEFPGKKITVLDSIKQIDEIDSVYVIEENINNDSARYLINKFFNIDKKRKTHFLKKNRRYLFKRIQDFKTEKTFFIAYPNNFESEIPFILLSYPRSGNHWIRYIIEWFSSRKTLGASEGQNSKDFGVPYDMSICERTNVPHVNISKQAIAIKRHRLNDWDPRDSRLLFVIRNPFECVVRNLEISKSDFNIKNEKVQKNIDWYFDLIKEFENWKSEKYIIKYEDIISDSNNFISTLKNMTEWMGIHEENKFNDFIKKTDFHRKNSLETVKARGGSDGEKRKFHSEKLTNKQKEDWIKYIKENHGNTYEKYRQYWT